jgi:hypothetical protein
MKHQRGYTMKSTPPIPEDDEAAARRMVARMVTDPAERAEVEQMLGVAA